MTRTEFARHVVVFGIIAFVVMPFSLPGLALFVWRSRGAR